MKTAVFDSRAATREDVDRILSEHPLELEELIPVEPVQLSQPLQGRPRVKVSVRPGEADAVPKVVEFRLNDRRVRVHLEVCEDYRDYRTF